MPAAERLIGISMFVCFSLGPDLSKKGQFLNLTAFKSFKFHSARATINKNLIGFLKSFYTILIPRNDCFVGLGLLLGSKILYN